MPNAASFISLSTGLAIRVSKACYEHAFADSISAVGNLVHGRAAVVVDSKR